MNIVPTKCDRKYNHFIIHLEFVLLLISEELRFRNIATD